LSLSQETYFKPEINRKEIDGREEMKEEINNSKEINK
jgi:hypothetical protein